MGEGIIGSSLAHGHDLPIFIKTSSIITSSSLSILYGSFSMVSLPWLIEHTSTRDFARLYPYMDRPNGSFHKRVAQSSAFLQKKQHHNFCLDFDTSLPINQRLSEITECMAQHQVVILCGETGSGKTTQIPKICLTLGWGRRGLIGHTQPRRLAARSVAKRLADELGTQVGAGVGLKIRFNEQGRSQASIKLMTDGILLAETQSDPLLAAYEVLIIDEAHERSLNIDFLLGYIKKILPRRPDLRVIITSATIDADMFSQHFSHAPVLEVSGRTYPVEIRYRPLQAKEEDEQEAEMEDAIVATVEDLAGEAEGDILVFLPGEREIRETAEAFRRSLNIQRMYDLLPLYARLSNGEQRKIFHPSGRRRIILATNVAETSLTVPGIRYVIDTGLARVKRYSPRAKVEQLHIENISQAAARQRAGRCGRVSSGVCIRLYSEQDFNHRPSFTDPEILRANLASVMLRMAALGLGDIQKFPFLQSPSSRQVSDGLHTLREIGALDVAQHLTEVGKVLARLPVDPKIARWLLAGQERGCLADMLILASGLSVQDPRDRPMDQRDAADRAHKVWESSKQTPSDFMSILALWHGVHSGLSGLSLRKQISWCHERFLSHARFREWRDLHQQLSEVCQDIGWDILKTLDHPDIIHQCLLTGLLSQIAYKDPQSKTFEYIAPRGLRVVIHPGSSLKKKSPQWIMAAEWLDTSRPFARIVAPIMPEWLEQIAGHLVHKSYLDPRFDAKRGEVVATAKISLYGLHILTHAQVSYGRVDPIKAREVFIRQALVEGLYPKKQANFYVHNQSVYESIETLEHKTRQDWLDWDDVLFAFYDEKIPNECVDVVSFVAWQKHHDSQLHLSLELILDSLSKHQAEEQFPEQFLIDGSPLALRYRFEPRHELDGVTLLCPLSWLNRLRAERLEWLVPGMIREKIFLLLKNLPKDQRRALMPLEQSVTQFLSSGIVMDHGLCDQLAVWVGKHTGQRIRIHPEDFHPEQLPIHMFMRIEILDETGHELASSRNLLELQTRLGEAAQLSFRQDHTDEYERIGVERWDFGDLPQVIHTSHGMQAYPALSMMPDGRLALKALDTLELATKEHAHGVLALLMLSLPAQIKQIQKNWVSVKQASLAWRLNDLSDDAVYFLLRQAALADGACVPRTMVEFEAMRERVKVRLPSLVHGFDIILNDVRQKYSVLNDMITKHHPLRSCFDAWMAQLFVPRFLRTMPWHIWQSMPRYLSAWHIRIQKYSGRILRDAEEQKQVDRLLHAYAKACQQLHQKYQEVPEALEEFRWECEELRVSLWAQELKTPRPVSVKRLEKFWMQQGFDRWVRLSS